jgi:predicted RNA-binding Zn-ribbon protein involved in translation (DUF1610 family)
MWQHVDEVEHDEHCEVCKGKLEIRFLGVKDWVFYCPTCLKHEIKPALDNPNGEIRK